MKIEIYKDKKGDWRWRTFSANGRQLAKSSEGYHNEADNARSIELVFGDVKARKIELVRI